MCERPALNEGGEGSSPNSLYAGLFLSLSLGCQDLGSGPQH